LGREGVAELGDPVKLSFVLIVVEYSLIKKKKIVVEYSKVKNRTRNVLSKQLCVCVKNDIYPIASP
jgi:hypothetical protein